MTAVLCTSIVPVSATPKPPPNPTNQQLASAAVQKSLLAHQVGVLSAEIVQAQSELRTLAAQAELAEQKFARAVAELRDSEVRAAKAKADVAAAQNQITRARRNLTSYVRDSYMSPPVNATTIGLLTATDPAALLQGGDYQNYLTVHHLDAITALDRATVGKANADARAKQAVITQTQLKNAADRAQQQAQQAYAAEQAQSAHLRLQQVGFQNALDAAQLQLASLNNQRAKYLAYQRAVAALAAERARIAAAAAARAHAAQVAALQAQQARIDAQNAANSNSGNSNSGSSSGSSSGGAVIIPAPSGPSAGGWTAARGAAAAAKALSQVGMPYAWAGGGLYGPTYGVDSPGTDGWNDHTVFGFDCSGLTMFGWYPALSMPHYAASQYYAGNFHPQPGQFLPGDLLFWSDGGIDAIHHVAMYIGNGNVVQAPNSGDVVRVTPWDQVSPGYLGATRPLT